MAEPETTTDGSGPSPEHGFGLLALAGFLATAVSYGPARMGFGLFLPEFREQFSLSTEMAGFIASAAFLGFLLALPLSGILTARRGPRLSVVTGGLLAASGMALVAVASNVMLLAVGVVVAATSAGFCWTPYNNAAGRLVTERRRPRVLSAISTGTTIGIAVAGLLAMLMVLYGYGWRVAWWAFSGIGLLAVAVNLPALRRVAGSAGQNTPDGKSTARAGRFLRWELLPPFTAALSFGITSAIYLSFAADRIVNAGGLPGVPEQAAAPVVFMAYGVVGIIGLATGRFERWFGLVSLLGGIFCCLTLSLALIAIAPLSWPAVLVSAGLQGACVMTISAVFSFWSLRLFPDLPASGFTMTLLMVATGSVLGPALAGLISGAFGATTMFLVAAALSLATVPAVCLPLMRQDSR